MTARVFSGRCLCGHRVEEHNSIQGAEGVLIEECEHYGFNERGGLDEDGRPHCERYADSEDPDPQTRERWRVSCGKRWESEV